MQSNINENSFLKVVIWNNLNYYAYEDATFLAERLCSESEYNVYTEGLNFASQCPQ